MKIFLKQLLIHLKHYVQDSNKWLSLNKGLKITLIDERNEINIGDEIVGEKKENIENNKVILL